MLYLKNRNRLKIPNRIAAMAALLLLVSSFIGPANTAESAAQNSMAEQTETTYVDGSVTELVVVAVTAAKPVVLSISSLIFRF